MNYKVVKCPNCQEIQFDYGQEYCNFCHKKLYINLFDDIFKDIFNSNNDLGIT